LAVGTRIGETIVALARRVVIVLNNTICDSSM